MLARDHQRRGSKVQLYAILFLLKKKSLTLISLEEHLHFFYNIELTELSTLLHQTHISNDKKLFYFPSLSHSSSLFLTPLLNLALLLSPDFLLSLFFFSFSFTLLLCFLTLLSPALLSFSLSFSLQLFFTLTCSHSCSPSLSYYPRFLTLLLFFTITCSSPPLSFS